MPGAGPYPRPGWRDFDAVNVNFHVLNKAKTRLDSLPRKEPAFIEPMECLSVSKLPEGSQWLWEIKLDGYRALAVKSGSDVTLFSRRRKSLNRKFPYVVEALADLPDGTVVQTPDLHAEKTEAQEPRLKLSAFSFQRC